MVPSLPHRRGKKCRGWPRPRYTTYQRRKRPHLTCRDSWICFPLACSKGESVPGSDAVAPAAAIEAQLEPAGEEDRTHVEVVGRDAEAAVQAQERAAVGALAAPADRDVDDRARAGRGRLGDRGERVARH